MERLFANARTLTPVPSPTAEGEGEKGGSAQAPN